MSSTFLGADGLMRCSWCSTAPEFLGYHDKEWGFPVVDDFRLFEKICLEGFQSGLSWRTILAKREHFRAAFLGFDFNRVSCFDEQDVDRLLQNEGIVRHKGKIEAVIHNATCAQALVQEAGSLAAFFWCYEPNTPELPAPQTASTSPASIALSKELKRRGWKFVGPTTLYAFMQAMGLINDHVPECVTRLRVEHERTKLKKAVLMRTTSDNRTTA